MVNSCIIILLHILANFSRLKVDAGVSYNHPNVSSCTQWNSNGITIMKSLKEEFRPLFLFIDSNDTMFILDHDDGRIYEWKSGNNNPTRIIFDKAYDLVSMFISRSGDIYASSFGYGEISQWRATTNTIEHVTYFCDYCSGIFIDRNNALYCSLTKFDQVVVKSLGRNSSIKTVLAGVGFPGSDAHMLDIPLGIFVNTNFDLYVADANNHRIQLFRPGEIYGRTVVGSTTSDKLYYPQEVILDVDNNIYIADSGNDRIVVLRSHEFRCLLGCTGFRGSSPHKLFYPTSLALDSFGNMYVVDRNNYRIQKFSLTKNTCDDTSHSRVDTTTTSTAVPSPQIRSVYTSVLNTYRPTAYEIWNESIPHYEIASFNVLKDGYYEFFINSTTQVIASLYKEYFDPLNHYKNVLLSNCGIFGDILTPSDLLKFTVHLRQKEAYVIVMIILREKIPSFSIVTTGPANVNFTHIDTLLSIVNSTLSLELNNNSPKHGHENCESIDYYYEALQLTIAATGYYTVSIDSNFGAFVYVYKDYFNLYDPRQTYVGTIESDCNNFELTTSTAYFEFNTTYVLVVTTVIDETEKQGVFTITIGGANNINMEHIVQNHNLSLVQTTYSSTWTEDSPIFGPIDCKLRSHYYVAIQIDVEKSGTYSFSSRNIMQLDIYGSLHAPYFDAFNAKKTLIPITDDSCMDNEFVITIPLQSSKTYVLVVTTILQKTIGNFTIVASGPHNIILQELNIQSAYTSKLTEDTQVFARICGQGKYHYETIEMTVQQTGSYSFSNNTDIFLFGYIYENDFDPYDSRKNQIAESNYHCNVFGLSAYLQINKTYILVITTYHAHVQGSFTIIATGPNNITFNHIVKKQSSCVVGDQCQLLIKTIGLTLNDIFRNQIQLKVPLTKQSLLIQLGAGITMIMFVGGLINSVLSLITFQNKQLRKVGCGLYLLASSITSLLTIIMFVIKFWFVVSIQLYSNINPFFHRTECLFIGPMLRVCLYLDGWLNACVAIERTVSVSKGVNFNQKKSRHVARWIIRILPIVIIGSIVHEPFHHELFAYTSERLKPEYNNLIMNTSIEDDDLSTHEKEMLEASKYETFQHYLCIIRYSRSFQNYNTFILFFHLIAPFIANLYSAIYIIIATARRRSAIQTRQTLKEHVIRQLDEHKQLLISPLILLALTLPRLIFALVSNCVDPSDNPWLYLGGYFISFIPSMLIFVVFVLPSELYKKSFKESIAKWRPRNHH